MGLELAGQLYDPPTNSRPKLRDAPSFTPMLFGNICTSAPMDFSFSTTSTLVFFNRGYAVIYKPITIHQRHQAVKSTVKLSTGFDTIILILRLASLFQPLRLFVPASGLFILLGILWGLPYIFLLRGVSVGALLLILTGLLLFFFGLLTDQVAQLRLEKYE